MNTDKKMMLIDKARTIAESVYAKFGIMPDFHITINTHGRMTSTAGRAYLKTKRIDLSWPFLDCLIKKDVELAKKEFENTVIHEACHLIAYKLYGDRGHGWGWATCMLKCGLEPKRCHSHDFRKNRKECLCACGTIKVGPTVYKRIKAGLKYSCKNCRTILKSVE